MEATALRELVQDGKFFFCSFIKRTDGTVRNMLARVGVKSSGSGELAYKPEAHNLILAWDIRSKGYRMIPADAILVLKEHGRTHYLNRPR